MKLPIDIVGKNKIRDFAICRDYVEGLSPREIVLKYARTLKISIRRVQIIISNNAVFVSKHIGWDKTKRLHVLGMLAKKEIQKGAWLKQNTDILDILKEIREEMEGDKPKEIKHTGEIHHTVEVVDVEERIARLRGDSQN